MADTTDDDLIRRGDALEAVTDTSVKWGFTGEPAILIDTKAAIRALPAQVQPAHVALTIKLAAVEALVERAFKDGMSYANNVNVLDPAERQKAWEWSQVRADLAKIGGAK